MDRLKAPRSILVHSAAKAGVEDLGDDHAAAKGASGGDGPASEQSPPSNGAAQDPSQGSKGDYIGVHSYPYLMKILSKQDDSMLLHFKRKSGDCVPLLRIPYATFTDLENKWTAGIRRAGDKKILFADEVLRFTESGKMKRRILLITDFAIYLVDPEADRLKRRIALAAVERIWLSKLRDNFFAIIIPSEYDCLMASTRKKEIVTVLVDATKSTSEYEIEVAFSNSFEYNAAADIVKEVHFEEVDGGVRTKIQRKRS